MGQRIETITEVHPPSDEASEDIRKLRAMAAELQQCLAQFDPRSFSELRPASPDPIFCAKRLEKERRLRMKYFPQEVTWDPAWPMLIELFRCRAQAIELPITSLCFGVDIPAATGRRWIDALARHKLVEKWHSARDARQTIVQLSVHGYALMEQYLLSIS